MVWRGGGGWGRAMKGGLGCEGGGEGREVRGGGEDGFIGGS